MSTRPSLPRLSIAILVAGCLAACSDEPTGKGAGPQGGAQAAGDHAHEPGPNGGDPAVRRLSNG